MFSKKFEIEDFYKEGSDHFVKVSLEEDKTVLHINVTKLVGKELSRQLRRPMLNSPLPPPPPPPKIPDVQIHRIEVRSIR